MKRWLHKNYIAAVATGVLAFQITFTGCKSGVNDAVTTYGSDPYLQNGVLVFVAMPAYVLGVRTPKAPAIVNSGTPEQIRNSAIAAARAAIAAGKPRVAYTGDAVSQPVGVPVEYLDLVKNLQKVPLPSGPIDNLTQVTMYAEAYNKEILQYLLNKNETRK